MWKKGVEKIMQLPKNKSNRKAVVLTADKFEDMEVFFPYFRLLEEGWQVDIAAPGMKEISGEHGYVLKPDKTIDEVDPGEYDLLIIPGGAPNGAPATVRKIKKAQEIARSFAAKNKPVASICHCVLRGAGVEDTTYFNTGRNRTPPQNNTFTSLS